MNLKLSQILENKKRKDNDFTLSSYVDIHDPHNLEINTNFELYRGPVRGELEAYLFFPKSFGLTEIAHQQLMADLQVRMRLSSRGKEKRIRKTLESLLEQAEDEWLSAKAGALPSEDERNGFFRRVGTLLGDWMVSKQILVSKELSHFEESDQTAAELERAVKSLEKGLISAEGLILRTRKIISHHHMRSNRTAQFLNEYTSQQYIVFLEFLRKSADSLGARVSASHSAQVDQRLDQFRATLGEKRQREASDPDSAALMEDIKDSPDLLGMQMLKLGYLKKYFQSESFVDLIDTTTHAHIVEPVSMFSAALAGLIAALAVVFTREAFTEVGHEGYTLLDILFILTFIYVFRDRLKEVTKNYLTKRLSQVLPDNRAILKFKKRKLGVLKAWLNVNPAKPLSAAVRHARREASFIEADMFIPEDILHIRRVFDLDFMRSNKNEPGPQLHDIQRINFYRYMRYMDSAHKPISVLSRDGKIETLLVPRNYLVFLVLNARVAHRDQSFAAVESTKIFRIHMNKDGIQKLELVRKSKLRHRNDEQTGAG